MTWRVNADPTMAVAGVRALLLQATHPTTMAGVLQHDGFHRDPWGRLARTGRYVGTVNFGTKAQAHAAARRVRRLHASLHAVDPVSGQSFRIDSPELLLWVHCTEVDSFLTTYRRAGGPLGPGEGDRYLSEQRRAAKLVGLNQADVPANEAELADYFVGIRPQLRVTWDARRAACAGLWPPMPGWVGFATPARPAWISLVGLAAALLPRWARRLYGFPGLPTTDVAADLALRVLRNGVRALPATWWQSPLVRRAHERVTPPAPTSTLPRARA